MITHIATAAISYVADFNVTKGFAQKAYARLTRVIAGYNTHESEVQGEMSAEGSKETHVHLETVIESLKSHMHGQWESPH